MNTSDAIRSRRSIRKYVKGAQIPQEHYDMILEAAMMAPSACNRRPWEFIVIENEEKKEELLKNHPFTKMLQTATAAIIVCGRPDLQKGICEGFWPQDCGAAIQNLLLQAKELGYGTCWCGLYPTSRAEVFQELLGITSVPMAVIAIGVPDEEPEARGFFEESRVTYIR